MNAKSTHQKVTKKMRKENLSTLISSIDAQTFSQFITNDDEWNDCNIIITIKQDGLTADESTCVLTKHAVTLSNFMDYVRKNIMFDADYYLPGFIAILANDFIGQYGDRDDYYPLLDYLIHRIYYYCKFYEYEWADDSTIFRFTRLLASDKISDEQIHHALSLN